MRKGRRMRKWRGKEEKGRLILNFRQVESHRQSYNLWQSLEIGRERETSISESSYEYIAALISMIRHSPPLKAMNLSNSLFQVLRPFSSVFQTCIKKNSIRKNADRRRWKTEYKQHCFIGRKRSFGIKWLDQVHFHSFAIAFDNEPIVALISQFN